MPEAVQYFHFVRPWVLFLVPAIVLLWALVRRSRSRGPHQPDLVASHLARAMLVGGADQRNIYPIDGVLAALVLIILAAAGPTWNRVHNPLLADSAPLVVAMKITESMLARDLAPSRLDRARFKVLDLIEARAGARTALIAYAGSAHRVSPLTEDPNILRPLLEGLTPQVMPQDGADAAAALSLAQDVLATSDTAGAVLFVADEFNPVDVAAFNAESDPARPPVIFLVIAPDTVSLPQLDRIANASVVHITPNDKDLNQIARQLISVYQADLVGDTRLEWEERGALLTWPAAFLVLLWFRRGWTMRWVLLLAFMFAFNHPNQAAAEGWRDWFLTPDQQGMIAYQNKEPALAGELFADPFWKGFAKMRAGQYGDAADIFARLDSAEAAFAQGMSHIRNREYRPAISAFEAALERRSDYPQAAHNLEIAVAILAYIESAREQSDTGEESGIGADDIVFDNEAARGTDTEAQQTDETPVVLSAEQWMSSIDTDMGDFLRTRFLYEHREGLE